MFNRKHLNVPTERGHVVELPLIKSQSCIPRIIHQTYRPRPWPDIIATGVDELRTLNPDWEYRFYDDDAVERCILDFYGPIIFSYYDRIHPSYGAARADLFRYLLMYREGGVYLDIKSRVSQRLSSTVDRSASFVLSHWPTNAGVSSDPWAQHGELEKEGLKEFQQWHIICAPGHAFLRAVIEAVLRNVDTYSPVRHKTGKYAVLQVTGPIAYTMAVQPLMATEKYVMRRIDDLGIHYSVFGEKKSTHEDVLPVHYSASREPLIKQSALATASFKFLREAKRLSLATYARAQARRL